jgi:hypothetical protein
MTMTAMAGYSGPGGPAWKVTGAAQTTGLGPNGQYQRGWEVTYQLEGGTTGTVFVPAAAFSPETVRAAVADDAARLAAVLGLTSG